MSFQSLAHSYAATSGKCNGPIQTSALWFDASVLGDLSGANLEVIFQFDVFGVPNRQNLYWMEWQTNSYGSSRKAVRQTY